VHKAILAGIAIVIAGIGAYLYLKKRKPQSPSSGAININTASQNITQQAYQAYQQVGIANPQQYLQGLQAQVYAEAPSTYQQYQGQYVGYGAE
jgi:hypothetical protein